MALVAVGCGGSSTSPGPMIPNYAGNWKGTVTIAGCTQTGVWTSQNLCPAILGQPVNFTMALTQNGSTVSGTFVLSAGGVTFPDATINPSSGSLVIVGTVTDGSVTAVTTWSLAAPITGTVSQVATVSSADGQLVFSGPIVTATRQ